MAPDTSQDITGWLRAWRQGDQAALDRLAVAVDRELRRMAQARMKQLPPGQTLQPTALVHEAYLRLMGRPIRSLSVSTMRATSRATR